MTHKTYPKSATVRSESYRRWVASLPCAGCGVDGYSQAAHPNNGKGLGSKTSDLLCFPLCSTRPGHMGCHYMHDNCIGMSRHERRDLELIYTARTQAEAMKQYRKEIT